MASPAARGEGTTAPMIIIDPLIYCGCPPTA